VAKLRQEELNVLIGELPQLVAEDIVNADVVRIASRRELQFSSQTNMADAMEEKQETRQG
jgi:hypothetical protein